MKKNTYPARTGLILCASLISFSSHATLIDRGNGMIYDDGLDITWLADANYSKTTGYDVDGKMDWKDALIWAERLEFGGFNDWRLPRVLDPGCVDLVPTYPSCKNGEMSHMFYSEFDAVHGGAVFDALPRSFGIQNLQTWAGNYWYENEGWINPSVQAFEFGFNGGDYAENDQRVLNFAWAVRDGDVLSTVPLPGTMWFLGSGMLALIGVVKKWGTRYGVLGAKS